MVGASSSAMSCIWERSIPPRQQLGVVPSKVVIALVVTPDGLPLAYEVLPGNTADSNTLRNFLKKIEKEYGRARRVWVMDRGIPTEAVLAEMRACDPPVQYLVGTPKGRLSQLEKHLLAKPWQEARQGVQVKMLTDDGELYVFAQSDDRVAKERAMRRRQLKWLWKRLGQLVNMEISREEMLMKLGAARARAPTAWRLIDIEMDKASSMFIYTLNRKKLRTIRRREGRYLLRTNLTDNDPALLWQYYTQLVAVDIDQAWRLSRINGGVVGAGDRRRQAAPGRRRRADRLQLGNGFRICRDQLR
jgi:hypothetical protein